MSVKGSAVKKKMYKTRKADKDKQRLSHGELIVIGFTGSLGSGCTFISEGLANCLRDGRYFSLSQIIKDKLKEEGIVKPTIEQLQDEGNRLREEKGLSVLANLCITKVEENGKARDFTEDTVILIDGIRNNGEIRCLRALPNFYLVSVHAEEKIRRNRLVGAKKKFKKEDDFKVANTRDKEEDFEYGQQVNICNYFSDIIINNDKKHIKKSENEKDFFQKIEREYIDRMRKIRKGEKIFDHPPSIDESLMTTAYCTSKRSSCDKRKVGAVIAHISEIEKLKEEVKRPEDHIKFQIISSGYNEVPLGTAPCRLDEHEKCQRDYLKEEFAQKIEYCPRCGKKIPMKTRGDYRAFLDYQCEQCKTYIASEYLPGSGTSSGKLLDMCRALHAEEISILGLEGISKVHGVAKEGKKDRFVLYTTTYPCNLCANKIVAAGIDKVVYAEPYTMEESRKILELGGVDVVKFEGVKSTAYFRLYS